MKTERCGDLAAHGRHEWYWKKILRRDCPGQTYTVAFCGKDETHAPHWHGEYRDEWCRGSGLAGVCEHGIGMLDHCDDCRSGDVEPLMNEIIQAHNDLYHPGRGCAEDDAAACVDRVREETP